MRARVIVARKGPKNHPPALFSTLAHASRCTRMRAQGQAVIGRGGVSSPVREKGGGRWFADNKTVHHVTSLQRLAKREVRRRYTKHEQHASQLRGNGCTRLESLSRSFCFLFSTFHIVVSRPIIANSR